ncbi:hypothetical protein PF001_g1885 [Phytophthora fragariae]|nr:hypothetical protein PF001_g1885 [Phytophthora fragariae]
MKLEADREGLSSSPDLIIISDTSDDEEDKPAPPKEVLGKRERPHDSDAPPRASSDGCPPCKRRLTEPFEQADAQPLPQPPIHAHTAVPPPKNRQPAPARLNYVIREVKVWRESASKPRAHEPPRTPPDAKATICSSPLSTLKQVVRASTPKVAFSPAKWPGRVAYLHENYNSKAIKLPYVYHFGDCGCGDPCKIESCRNARMNIFCTDKCCCWEELCANRPRESDKLEVMQHDNTMQYALVATSPIKAGQVVGEYLGQLRYMPKEHSRRSRNQGYMLNMRARTDGIRELAVGIDAQHLGGRMRFANHSCSANARFFEFANGRRHTIVVVTTQDIVAGGEITVNYGHDLWFVCHCDEDNCVHRDIQDHEDP